MRKFSESGIFYTKDLPKFLQSKWSKMFKGWDCCRLKATVRISPQKCNSLESWPNPELGNKHYTDFRGKQLLKFKYKMDITLYCIIILNFPISENGMVS